MRSSRTSTQRPTTEWLVHSRETVFDACSDAGWMHISGGRGDLASASTCVSLSGPASSTEERPTAMVQSLPGNSPQATSRHDRLSYHRREHHPMTHLNPACTLWSSSPLTRLMACHARGLTDWEHRIIPTGHPRSLHCPRVSLRCRDTFTQ